MLNTSTLTHWGRVTHICVSKLTTIGSDNGLSPDRRQAITWTNAGILLIGPLRTNISEILIEILAFSFKKMRMSSAKWRPFCLGLNVTAYELGRVSPTSVTGISSDISTLLKMTPLQTQIYTMVNVLSDITKWYFISFTTDNQQTH